MGKTVFMKCAWGGEGLAKESGELITQKSVGFYLTSFIYMIFNYFIQ